MSPQLSASDLLPLDVRARKEGLCHHGSVHLTCYIRCEGKEGSHELCDLVMSSELTGVLPLDERTRKRKLSVIKASWLSTHFLLSDLRVDNFDLSTIDPCSSPILILCMGVKRLKYLPFCHSNLPHFT